MTLVTITLDDEECHAVSHAIEHAVNSGYHGLTLPVLERVLARIDRSLERANRPLAFRGPGTPEGTEAES